jgi:hypothetical protein
VQAGFGGDCDIAITGVSSTGCSGAPAGGGSDCSALAASRDSSDDGAYRCTSARTNAGALAARFTLFRHRICVNGIALPVCRYRGERDRQHSAAFYMSGLGGLRYGAANMRAFRQNFIAIHHNRLGQRSLEAVAGVIGLRADVLIDRDGESFTCVDYDWCGGGAGAGAALFCAVASGALAAEFVEPVLLHPASASKIPSAIIRAT